ncbi:hypothetical protein [Microbacterium sp. NPDC089696]|uniref:hypothetical protein n=1 Tax=Microbacterium sp. NPDC089696 TaxID=3364199 RepID=UPI0037F137AE
MTVTKHEILTVTSPDSPAAMIAALSELPEDARFMGADRQEASNFAGHEYLSAVSMTFRRRATDG